MSVRDDNFRRDKMKPTPEFEESLKSVIKHMLDLADEERSKSDSYKDLFESTDGISFKGALRKTYWAMISSVLDFVQVVEQKTGKTINKEMYNILCALPYIEKELTNNIRKNEGSCCCVDKTFHLLNMFLLENLKDMQ